MSADYQLGGWINDVDELCKLHGPSGLPLEVYRAAVALREALGVLGLCDTSHAGLKLTADAWRSL